MSGTVTVACKVPNGIRLSGDVVVRGPAQVEDPSARPGGFALTEVPEDVWREWLERSSGATIVERSMIFAGDDPAEVRQKARRLARVRTGLEPTAVA